MFSHIRPGDKVVRMLAGVVRSELNVSFVTDDLIICGPKETGWTFCRKTGVEIDEELGWGPDTHTGSYLVLE